MPVAAGDGNSFRKDKSEDVGNQYRLFCQKQFVVKRLSAGGHGDYFGCSDLGVVRLFDIFFKMKSALNLSEKSFRIATHFAEDSFTWVTFPVFWLIR
ncbi:MAG: hypothetical protein DME26_00670 [Verrucomicrobia bacterium]|nr:MAG: hypothetical protein DME26_00670 [Verrucomicrobiota bacterium]